MRKCNSPLLSIWMTVPVSTRHFIVCQSCVTYHTFVIHHFFKYDMIHEGILAKYYILAHLQ